MKMTSKYWLAAVGIVLAGSAYATGFKHDDFENYANGTPLSGGTNQDWGASSSSVVVQTNLAHLGLRAAVVPVSASLSNTINASASSSKVWSDFWTVPRLYVSDTANGPAPDLNATAQFFVASNGVWTTISKANGLIVTNQWTTDVNNNSLSPYTEAGSNWVHVSVFHDYSHTNWSFFLNGVPVALNLGFINTNIPNYAWFNMQNGGGNSAWLDDVTISNRVPSDLQADSDHNGMVDAWEIQYFGSMGTTNTASADLDEDGINNGDESSLGTDPYNPLDPSAPLAAALPWADYFNALGRNNHSLYGQAGWDAAPTANVQVVLLPPSQRYMGQAVQMGAGYASHLFGPNPAYTSVWTHLVLKPIQWTGSKGTEVTTDAMQFYVSNNVVMALSNATWVSLSSIKSGPGGTNAGSFTVDTTRWVRFVSKSDYGTHRWSLYAQNVDGIVTSRYARLIGDNLAFNSSAASSTYYQGLVVTNLPDVSSTGYLDNVEITLNMSPWIDTDGDGVPDYFQQQSLGSATNPGVITPTEYALGITNANGQIVSVDLRTNTSPDIALNFNVGSNRTYHVLGGSDPNGSFSTVLGTFDTTWNATNYNFTVTNGLALAGTNRYFVKIAAATSDGVTGTNPVTYAWYVQPRTTNSFYWVTMPVDYGTNNTLDKLLGQHLARGLAGDGHTYAADIIQIPSGDGTNFISAYLAPDLRWRYLADSSTATSSIPVGTAFMVQRRANSATMASTIFAGPAQTNSVAVALHSGWNMVGWPFDNTNSAWASGFTNGTVNSDVIYLKRGTAYQQFTLRTNGWWSPGKPPISYDMTSLAPLQPGEGLMYKAGAAAQWAPTRP